MPQGEKAMASYRDEPRVSAQPGRGADESAPVDEHSDMADVATRAFADDLAAIAEAYSCADEQSS